jgi:capsule polysaccharide export protein KpsE/RkpR
MNPNDSQWNVVQLSEKRFSKANAALSQFGPIRKGIVKPKSSKQGDSDLLRQHEDEAIALGNSWRDADK